MLKLKKQGTVLIVVLGVLVLLALLATSFATLQGIERKVTRNYTDEVRAKLVAQSGVEMAVDRLTEVVRQGWMRNGQLDTTWMYYGGSKNPADYYNAEALNIKPGTASTIMGNFERADVLRGPLDKAARPSFAREKDNPADVRVYDPYNAVTDPWQIRVEGNDIGFSGIVGGTYGGNADVYSTKIIDCQSQINVNDGAKWGSSHSVSQNVKRMLNILGAQPSVGILNLGDLIINNRPPNGYQNKYELLRVVQNDETKFNRFKDYVTTSSWTNDRVHNPVPLSATEDVPAVYPVSYDRPTDSVGQKIYRHGHQKNRMGDGGIWTTAQPAGGGRIDSTARPWPLRFFNPALDTGWPSSSNPWHAAFWAYDALNPQWIEQVSRSPVNVNTATKEVLTALVTDLEGFFACGRRYPNPADIFYGFLPHRYYYDPAYSVSYAFNLAGGAPSSPTYIPSPTEFTKHSEIGYIYRTIPFAGPGGRSSETGIGTTTAPVSRIVEEILACRERQASPNLPGVNYAMQPFGGPFRSWAQFNLFVDFLVKTKSNINNLPLIYDNRPGYYYDYATTCTQEPINWYGTRVGTYWRMSALTKVTSQVQIRIASQAAADVLKANFNPNLHLNELNPDRNLFTNVDKTDLIVNSTEFCFVPMGSFEIESMGFVLKPPTLNADCLTTPLGAGKGNEIVARKLISAVVKLYDAEYVGLQSQLYRGPNGDYGEFGERQTFNPTTNNNRATESGPEPDNGPQPMECHYDGYVQLSTHGGLWEGNTAFKKPAGELWTTYSQAGLYPGCTTSTMGTGEFGSMVHAHFALDHVAHHHIGGAQKCVPLGPYRNNTSGGNAIVPVVKNYYLTGVAQTLTMVQAKAQAVAMAQADPYFAGCSNFTTPDAYSYMIKRRRNPSTGQVLGVYSYGSATTDVSALEAPIDNFFATNYPQFTDFVSLYCEYGVQVSATRQGAAMTDPTLNFPDITETIAGPYSPVMSGLQGVAPHKYRLCNSFQLSSFPPTSDTVMVPTAGSKYRYAPSDLRLDGMYGELHAAIGYNLQGSRFTTHQVSCFWFKPNYYPEATGRIRTMLSFVNYYENQIQGNYGVASLSYPLPFNLFFLPSYHSFEDPTMPVYGEPGRSVSMIYCVGADRRVLQTTSGGGLGLLSPTLNHEFEPFFGGNFDSEDFNRFTGKTDGKQNHFRHHEWHHITAANAPGSGFTPTPFDGAWSAEPDPANPRIRLFINGRELPGSKQMVVHVNDGPNDYSVIHGDSVRLGGELSETGIRNSLGQLVPNASYDAPPRIYYADGTIDEYYMWRDGDFRTQAQDLFRFGRYYRANMSNAADGMYTSPEIPLKTHGRVLAPSSTIASPPSTVTETVLPAPTATPRKRRLVAIAWTSYGEDYRQGTEPVTGLPRVEPYFKDYQGLISNNPPVDLPFVAPADANGYPYPSAAELSVLVQSGAQVKAYGTYQNEAWSNIKDSHEIGALGTVEGLPPSVDDNNTVKFRARLRAGAVGPSTVLLATPVLDDVTLFYDHSVIKFLSYVEVRN